MVAAKCGHFLVLGRKFGDAIDQQAAMLAAGRISQCPQHGRHSFSPVCTGGRADGPQGFQRTCRIAPERSKQHILL